MGIEAQGKLRKRGLRRFQQILEFCEAEEGETMPDSFKFIF